MNYKLYKTMMGQDAAMTIGVEPQISFIFAPDNTDYQAFKADILADKATLQDADGNEMSAEQAKAYIEELP